MRARNLPLFLLALLLAACFMETVSVGGATETETGTALVTGTVARPDGRTVAGARVSLRQDDFLPGSAPDTATALRDTLTDANGRFAFRQVRSGNYVLEAHYAEVYGVLSRFRVESDSGLLDLGVLKLQPVASASGRVRFSDSTLGPAVVRVIGTEHIAAADSATGRFLLTDLPPGAYDLRVSTPVPFFPSKDFPDLTVDSAATAAFGDLILDKGPKQEFSVANGRLSLAGIDGGNPVIYENDFVGNTWDNEVAWALASAGRIDLRGNLATPLQKDSQPDFTAEMAKWAREAEVCRQAGMRNIPDPIAGATRKLALPASGRWEDIVPESNPGILLLLAEARKASVEKPLVVLAGGPLTTVADALLLDPYIADKMVVFGAYNNTLNGKDSLASYLVASRCRFVEWGRDYFWAGGSPSAAALPTNRLGAQLKAWRDTTSLPQLFFADFSALAFLADNQAWTSARGAMALSPPLGASLGGQGPFDFVDIPQDANDWAAMDSAFFAILGNPDAYHPWPAPGTIAGAAFRAMSGAALDSIAGEGDIAVLGSGDWLDYAITADSAGDYDLILRNRCDTLGTVRIAGEDSASRAEVTLPAGTGWVETRTRLPLKKGVQTIRLTTLNGRWSLSRLQWEAAP